MTRTVRVLLINPGEPGHIRYVPADLDGMKEAIGGGWLEALTGDTWHAYCDEEGRNKGLPYNPVATSLAAVLRRVSEPLHGPVVFLSHDGEGDEQDVPPELVALHAWVLDSDGGHRDDKPMPSEVRAWLDGTRNTVRFNHDAALLTEVDANAGRPLRRIAVEIVRAMADHGFPVERTATLAARIGQEVYRKFGYQAEPLPVAAFHMSQEFIASNGERGHSMGMLGTGPTEDGNWDGHLVLLVNGLLVDLTAAQFSRPAQNIVIKGPALLDIPEGTALNVGAQLRHARADGGLTYYRITDDYTWQESPLWKGHKAEIRAMMAQASARAAQFVIDQQPPADAANGNVTCRRCRKPLSRFNLPDGTAAYQHTRPWEHHDHDAEPEFGAASADVDALCDFCDEPGGVKWIYTGPDLSFGNVNPFTGMPAEPGEPQVPRNEGPRWGACDICDRFIDAQDLEGLWASTRKTQKHRQADAHRPPHLIEEVRREIVGRWRRYIPHITRRLPVAPPELPPLNPRALPKMRDRLVRDLRGALGEGTFGETKYGAVMPGPDLDDHGTLSVVTSYVAPEVGRRFTERIASGLEDAALYYVSSDFTALALSSAQELPDVSLRPEELPAPRGLVVWEQPVMSIPTPHAHAADEAIIVGASWTTITDLGVWVVVYMRTEQFLPGQATQLGVLMPYSTGGGVEFGVQYQVNEERPELDHLAERTYKTLLATWFLILQPGVADVDHQPTNDKKLLKQAQRARVEPPEVRVVTLRRAKAPRQAGKQESGRTIGVRFMVRGHWKRQAYGTGRRLRKTIYVAPFMKGQEGMPLKAADNAPVVKVLR